MAADAGNDDEADEVGRYLARLQKVRCPHFKNATTELENSSIHRFVLISRLQGEICTLCRYTFRCGRPQASSPRRGTSSSSARNPPPYFRLYRWCYRRMSILGQYTPVRCLRDHQIATTWALGHHGPASERILNGTPISSRGRIRFAANQTVIDMDVQVVGRLDGGWIHLRRGLWHFSTEDHLRRIFRWAHMLRECID